MSTFYCGYVINSQAIFKCIKLSLLPEILTVTQDTVSYSFPVLPPFQPLSFYPPPFKIPLEKCFTTTYNLEFIFFRCNVCLANFGSERELGEFTIMSQPIKVAF